MEIKVNKNYEEMIKELESCGYKINDIKDLLELKLEDKNLIPILLKWLKLFENDKDKIFIAKCLGVKGFDEATLSLIKLFDEISEKNEDRIEILKSIGIIGNEKYINKYIKIITDKSNGKARKELIKYIGQFKDEKVKKALVKLLKDDEVNGYAIEALCNFKDTRLVYFIEPFTIHEDEIKRNNAKRYIEELKQTIEKENKELLESINQYGYRFRKMSEIIRVDINKDYLTSILYNALDNLTDPVSKTWIAKAFMVEGFTEATPYILKLFNELKGIDNADRMMVGTVLGIIGDDRYIDEYLKIIQDKSNGSDRRMLIYYMGQFKEEKVKKVLLELLPVKSLTYYVINALGDFKDMSLMKTIEPFLKSELPGIREVALEAIKKIMND